MIKSFDRYILKEIAPPFGIGLLLYTFTLLLNMILLLSEQLISKDVSGMTILKILVYLLPDFLSFTIPMATLMGILAGLGRMSTDSEIVAFKTLGIDNLRILIPIMLFSAVGWFVSSYLIMYVAPEANFRLDQLRTRIFLTKSVADIKSRVLNRDFPPYIIYFNDIDHNTGEWKGVFLYSLKHGDNDKVILAKRGIFKSPREEERYILLKNAWIHSFKKREPEKGCESTHWGTIKEKITRQDEIKNTRRYTHFLFPELVKKMKKEPKNILFAIEFHRKFALPFACLAMGFLALSLGISTKKGGRVSGFIISLGIIFIYYSIITASQNLVIKRIISPFVGMWSADIFLLVAGITAYYYCSKEKTINWERFFFFIERVKNRYYKRKIEISKKRRKVLFIIRVRRIKCKIFNILDLYVVKRLSMTFIFIFFSVILVFYIVTIMELVDNVIENNVAFKYLLEYLYYFTPEIVKFVLPVSLLTAVLLTFSVISKNNEIIAVQVSGISLYRLTFPAVILGIFLSMGFFYIQEEIAPGANRMARKTMDIIRKHKTPEEHEFHKNWVVGNNNEFYFYDFLYLKKKKYNRFNIIRLDNSFSLKKRISSKFAQWKNETELILEDGFERDFQDNNPLNFKKFKKRTIYVDGGKELFTKKIKDSRYMNIKALKQYIHYLERNKSDTNRYEAQLFNRYAFPMACLVMVLIAIPFSFMMGKKGTLYGIGLAVGISIIFWGVFAIFGALGSAALLSPFLSAFAPIFIFSGISIYLFMYVKT